MAAGTSELLPLLPLRDGTLFPRVGAPLVVGRKGSILAIERANKSIDRRLAVFKERSDELEPRQAGDLYAVGTVAEVRTVQQVQNSLTVVLQGLERTILEEVLVDGEQLLARVRVSPAHHPDTPRQLALCREVTALIARLVRMNDGEPQLVSHLLDPDDPVRLAYSAAALLGVSASDAQHLLELDDLTDVLQWLVEHLSREVHSNEIRRDIAQKVAGKLGAQQREFVLREQLQKIREELGESESGEADVSELRRRCDSVDLPAEAKKEIERELKRLERLPALAPEHHVVRGYIELVLDLPWNRYSNAKADISTAREILDHDHYALGEVKQRILEHLAILQLNPAAKAPIMCFLGPPGVGKTSLGQSVARALGRPFQRMSLGGVHDEAELRGHRRTYVGAMPGRVIQAVRRAGVADPLIMLDEIDKLGRDFRGDPASALLEILDPEQNASFRDNYLDLAFDLSKAMFITTCNTLETVPRPLLDRMEVIRLPGYSEEEKEEIARRYLIPRQLSNAGLDSSRLAFSDGVLSILIRRYTREAGVRELERRIARLVRKTALRIAERGGDAPMTALYPAQMTALLGPPPHSGDMSRHSLPPGVAAGLAWTEAGGEVLYVEVAKRAGSQELTLTGQLGDVMRESAKAAVTCIWSRAHILGISSDALEKTGLHIHVPAGAVPKDGPSAGVTMVTALASLVTGYAARPDTAMTGEITITGLVLPVGGIKEKLLAARRGGLHRVILPKQSEPDLAEVDRHVLDDMTILLAERIEEVWAHAIPRLAKLASTPAAA